MASLIKRSFKTGPVYYIQYWLGGKQKRIRAHESHGIAKQKLRDFENAQVQGDVTAVLPTQTPIAEVISGYIQHVRVAKTPKSAQTDIYYLRNVFGPICEALKITSRKLSAKTKRKPPQPGLDRRFKAPVVEANQFEAITTAQISAFIAERMASRGLAPKTGNRLRDTLSSLFSWAMTQRGIRIPGGKNPVTAVAKYKESAPEIRFLTLKQVDEQLAALADDLQLQVMVATLIYAGLRREELLWLQPADLDLAGGAHGIIRVQAKTVAGESWQPKTKRNRAVPISSQLRLYLDKWRLKHRAGEWLFPSPEGKKKLWDPDNFSADLRVENQKHGLLWGCLDYRHTFGSLLAMKGESHYKIATLMGNSPDICRRHYSALLTESLVESVEFVAKPGAAAPKANPATSA